MTTLASIVVAGVAMSLIALVGMVTIVMPDHVLKRVTLPLVALAAGSLIGGALFHLLPASLDILSADRAMLWLAAGFVAFFLLEEVLHYHHCRHASAECRRPLTYLILLGDGLHNFLGGLAVGSAFVIDVRLGWTAWIAAAVHEVPQELGDFGVLVHGGWPRRSALLYNFGSALTFLLGGLIAYAASSRIEVGVLLPFAAGNFLYIAASDLIPEIHGHATTGSRWERVLAFLAGLGLLLVVA